MTPVEYRPTDGDILIADFEGQDYGNWQVVGEALGSGPSQANTHRNRLASLHNTAVGVSSVPSKTVG